MGWKLTNAETGDMVEVPTTWEADDHVDKHPGNWKRERTPVPREKIPGFIPPKPAARTLRERAEQ